MNMSYFVMSIIFKQNFSQLNLIFLSFLFIMKELLKLFIVHDSYIKNIYNIYMWIKETCTYI